MTPVHVHPDERFPTQTLSFLLLSLTHPFSKSTLVYHKSNANTPRKTHRWDSWSHSVFLLVKGPKCQCGGEHRYDQGSGVLAPICTDNKLFNPVWLPGFVTFLWEFVTSPTMPFSSLYFLAQCLAESSETWTEPWSSGPVLSLRTFCRDGMFRICALTGGSWTFESWLVWLSNRLLHFI